MTVTTADLEATEDTLYRAMSDRAKELECGACAVPENCKSCGSNLDNDDIYRRLSDAAAGVQDAVNARRQARASKTLTTVEWGRLANLAHRASLQAEHSTMPDFAHAATLRSAADFAAGVARRA